MLLENDVEILKMEKPLKMVEVQRSLSDLHALYISGAFHEILAEFMVIGESLEKSHGVDFLLEPHG